MSTFKQNLSWWYNSTSWTHPSYEFSATVKKKKYQHCCCQYSPQQKIGLAQPWYRADAWNDRAGAWNNRAYA